jgi:hypothetical protein
MSSTRVVDVLYYTTKVKTPEGVLVSNNNGLSPTFTNPPSGGKGFVSARRLTNKNFDQYKDNNYYLMYVGYRVPPVAEIADHHLPLALYKEDVNIVTPSGSLHATSLYPDAGSSNETTISFTEFIVTGATGTFSGTNKILIEYSNNGDAPWSKDGNNEPVKSARKMTLLGEGNGGASFKQGSSNMKRLIM